MPIEAFTFGIIAGALGGFALGVWWCFLCSAVGQARTPPKQRTTYNA